MVAVVVAPVDILRLSLSIFESALSFFEVLISFKTWLTYVKDFLSNNESTSFAEVNYLFDKILAVNKSLASLTPRSICKSCAAADFYY